MQHWLITIQTAEAVNDQFRWLGAVHTLKVIVVRRPLTQTS